MPVPDYLIVANAAPAFRRIRLGLGLLTDQRLADCRSIGRGQNVPPSVLVKAMNTAALFWFLTMGFIMLALFAVMILIGSIFDHQAVGAPISAVILGLLLGMFTFAASSYGFTIVRSMYLSDGLLNPRGPAWAQRWSIAASTPKLRDSIISLTVGIIIAVVTPGIIMQM